MAHEIRCEKNPNRIRIVSNFKSYNEKIKNGELTKKDTNQFVKAKNEGKRIIISNETKQKISEKAKQKVWSKERKDAHSKIMRLVVLKNPDSYSAKNVCGRTKKIKCLDSLGNEVWLNGGWEKIFVDYMNQNNICWTRKIDKGFDYIWNEKIHFYFPDFKLLDYENTFVEIKGYQRDRDIEKWKQFPHKLIKIKLKEIKEIKNDTFKMNL